MPKTHIIFINHHIAQAWGIDKQLLNNKEKLLEATLKLAKELKLTVVNSFIHRFFPHGLSLVLVIAQSHLAIHTWPEYGYLHLDILSCSEEADLTKLNQCIKKQFSPQKLKSKKINY